VVTQQFSFAPASLRAFPVFGSGLTGLALILLPFLAIPRVPEWLALAVWVTGLLALGIIAAGIGLGWVSLGEPARQDANLIATRGSARPQRWIVAHLDSKAQAQSMAGRLIAVWVSTLAIVSLSVLSLVRLTGPVSHWWLALGAGVALAAGILAGRGRLEGKSLGARDNGTGMVAALAAAESSADPRVGILITGAEEFGLVGARVFARMTPNLQDTEFVNLDTLDQEGRLYIVSHDAAGAHFARDLEPTLAEIRLPVQRRRLPLGIFVDSAPLAKTRARSVTIGRLTWKTLRCIHTAADTPDGLSLETAERVGKVVTRIN
jgi:hypothetical protein